MVRGDENNTKPVSPVNLAGNFLSIWQFIKIFAYNLKLGIGRLLFQALGPVVRKPINLIRD